MDLPSHNPSGKTSTMTQLQRYIERYGELAGPKLYHALQSRAAYIGSSRRRGREIESLTGRPLRKRGPSRPKAVAAETQTEAVVPTPVEAPSLFPIEPVAVVA